MSEFIEKSKHGAMTAAVTSHFGTAKKRSMPGEADGKGFARFGDDQYNNVSMPFPEESGTNYRKPGDAGHTVK
jgi:hypothetical protein